MTVDRDDFTANPSITLWIKFHVRLKTSLEWINIFPEQYVQLVYHFKPFIELQSYLEDINVALQGPKHIWMYCILVFKRRTTQPMKTELSVRKYPWWYHQTIHKAYNSYKPVLHSACIGLEECGLFPLNDGLLKRQVAWWEV